jgi:tetraacyldisaccharide 4'-kinase
MRGLTFIGSILWSSVNTFMRILLRVGLLRSKKIQARVISVGNLQAGGAGKTPLVAQIAREAAERKLSVAILTRGYGGRWSKTGGILEPRQTGVKTEDCGDEALLLRDLAPEAWIAVGARRYGVFVCMLEKRGEPFDLVVLDDGFQHFGIRRDLDILAMTSARPATQLFRDFLFRAWSADLTVWSKGETRPIRADVRVRYELTPGNGKKVLLVTGVAQPLEVEKDLKRAGYSIFRHISFEDHTLYRREEIDQWLGLARTEGAVVALTGKDWVKWRELGVRSDEVIVLEPKLEFLEGRDLWNRTLWGS